MTILIHVYKADVYTLQLLWNLDIWFQIVLKFLDSKCFFKFNEIHQFFFVYENYKTYCSSGRQIAITELFTYIGNLINWMWVLL